MTGLPVGPSRLADAGRSQHRPDECGAADAGRDCEEHKQANKSPPPFDTVATRLIIGMNETHGPRAMGLRADATELQPVSLVPRVHFPRIHGPHLHGDRASLLDSDCQRQSTSRGLERPVREPSQPCFSQTFPKGSGVTHRKRQRPSFRCGLVLKKPWGVRCESPEARRRDNFPP